ncbi:hypothetical protein Tco_1073932 [Tanacetum coccineum]
MRAQEMRKNPPTKAQKRNTMSTYLKNMAGYKHNIDTKLVEGSEVRAEGKDKETVKLQKLIEVVPDKEEVAIDTVPLATKPPSIGRIVGIKRIHDDLGVTAAKCAGQQSIVPPDRSSAARQSLVPPDRGSTGFFKTSLPPGAPPDDTSTARRTTLPPDATLDKTNFTLCLLVGLLYRPAGTFWTVAPTPSSAIIKRPISTNFRIKGTHMQMIRDNQFDGRIRSDPHRHVADFLEISNLFQYGENQEEAVMLRTFPFSLCEEAKICFHQLGNETLVEAWIRLKEMLRICYGHGLTKGTIVHIFYHGLDGPTQGILDAGGIFLYNTPNEAFKILEDKDCIMHIPYTKEKVFKHDEISNHVGDKELISFVGIENEMSKRNTEDMENLKRPNVSPSLMEYIPKIPYSQAFKREISDLYRICWKLEGRVE